MNLSVVTPTPESAASGFVNQVKSVSIESVGRQCDEGCGVRLGVKAAVAMGISGSKRVNRCPGVEEAPRPSACHS